MITTPTRNDKFQAKQCWHRQLLVSYRSCMVTSLLDPWRVLTCKHPPCYYCRTDIGKQTPPGVRSRATLQPAQDRSKYSLRLVNAYKSHWIGIYACSRRDETGCIRWPDTRSGSQGRSRRWQYLNQYLICRSSRFPSLTTLFSRSISTPDLGAHDSAVASRDAMTWAYLLCFLPST